MSDSDLEEVIYESKSQLTTPFAFVRGILRDLAGSRELAWRLIIREISTRYRQTVLGYFWAIFPVLVNSVIFIFLNSSSVMSVKDVGVPYPVYVVMGTTFFAIFIDSMNAPLKIVTASKTMLVKINFPREAMVIAGMGEVLFNFAIKLVLLVLTFLCFGTSVSQMAFWAIIPLLGLLIIGFMVGIFLVPLGVLFQDFTYGLILASSGIMFLSPVGYPPPSEGLLALAIKFNPLTPLLMAAREFTLTGTSTYIPSMLVTMALSLVLFLIGWVIFRLSLPIVIERLGG